MAALNKNYGSPNNMDLWVGIIGEKALSDGILGELGSTIVA